MLKLFNGKREYMRIVQFGENTGLGKEIVWTPTEGVYAIPGGKRATEDEVRKWASREGFTVKKCY